MRFREWMKIVLVRSTEIKDDADLMRTGDKWRGNDVGKSRMKTAATLESISNIHFLDGREKSAPFLFVTHC